MDPDNQPPFGNDKGAEELLQEFFKSARPELFKFLHTDKISFISELIFPRS